MSTLLAIDPGNTESGWALIDVETRRPLQVGKTDNVQLRRWMLVEPDLGTNTFIEMIASYGMPVGEEVFDTVVWIGRFYETASRSTGLFPTLVKRQPIKLHHCHASNAKDSNIVQALVDRFAAGQPNRGKGTKSNPGWFHGFRADIWQAYALAVYAADQLMVVPW